MIPIIWHYNDGFWDCAFPKYLLNRAVHCNHVNGVENADLLKGPLGVIVIPGRHSLNDYERINKAAENFRRVVFLIIGDEEGKFQVSELQHARKIVWWFMPPHNPRQRVDRRCINGWPTNAPLLIDTAQKQHFKNRPYDWSFMGQITHERRIQCAAAAEKLPQEGFFYGTNGFAEGKPQEEYYSVMVRSKLVLCPSGPCTPDSFRFAEALEAGCIPIVDDLTPDISYKPGYWNYVLDELYLPFPLIQNWNTLPAVVEFWLKHWKASAAHCAHWWKHKKEQWYMQLREDLHD